MQVHACGLDLHEASLASACEFDTLRSIVPGFPDTARSTPWPRDNRTESTAYVLVLSLQHASANKEAASNPGGRPPALSCESQQLSRTIDVSATVSIAAQSTAVVLPI